MQMFFHARLSLLVAEVNVVFCRDGQSSNLFSNCSYALLLEKEVLLVPLFLFVHSINTRAED